MNKPAFDPNQPFQAVDQVVKPAFDPNQPFQETRTAPSEAPFKTPKSESLLRGFSQGATFGLGDEAAGALGGLERGGKYLLGKTQGDTGLLDAIRTGYLSDRNAERAANDKSFSDNPVTSIAGGLGAGVPQLAAKGAVSLASLLGQGIASGYGNSDSSNVADQAGDAAKGGLISGALSGVGAGISKLGAPLNTLKQELALKVLGAQKPQLRRLGGEYGGDVAQYALDNGLINPLKSVQDKQSLNNALQQNVGFNIDQRRQYLPQFDTQELLNAVSQRSDFNPNLEVNKDLTKQLNTVKNDISYLGQDKVNAKDVLDLKAQLYNLARKSNGEVNPAKDVLEQSRQAITGVEKKLADSGAYNQDLANYSKIKNIGTLLENKAAQGGNSVLGLGGLVGLGSAITATAAGHPGIGALGLLGLPVVRSKLAESSALGIDKAQKIAEKLNIDPRVVSYLLSKGVNQ